MIQFLLKNLRVWKRLQRVNQPVIKIEISKSALLNNLRAIEMFVPNWQTAPVLKSNAYGHGLILIADILKNEKNLPFFCIDSYFKAELLRNAGIETPLLIIGYTPTTTIQKNKLKNIFFMVGSLEQLEIIIKLKTRQVIHLKFDTGMHRQGISYFQYNKVLDILNQKTSIRIDGIMSHFSDADNPNSELTKSQIEKWNNLASQFQKKFSSIRYYHVANSAGLVCAKNIIANVARLGIALYGINPSENFPIKLQPVLQMKSIISGIHTIETNESVGYNATFVAQHQMKIATVPAGYFEGIDRRLSNKGFFIINNKTAPLIGRVSMNISSCDITDIDNIVVGSPVILISNRKEDQNSIENIAKLCDTIPYEILVHIPAHLRRNVVDFFD